MRKTFATFVIAASLVALGCSSGESKKESGEGKPGEAKPAKHVVAESEVPKPVLDAFAKAYPGAKATTWTERGGNYAVKGHTATNWVDVKFSADGKVKESAVQIAADAAPAPVKEAFTASPYAKMTFVDAMKRDNPEKTDYPTLYKFIVKDGENPKIAVYMPDGKFVKEKTMPADKLEKWKSEHTVAK